MTIRGVLFDFDGTLTCPGALDFPAIKAELGCPPDQPILEFLETRPWNRRKDLLRILAQKEDMAAGASSPNRGAVDCLSRLKKQGVPIGILTRNSLSSIIKALLKFEGVSIHDFKTLITREVVALPKPGPDGVLEAARQMGLLPSEILVVGDFRFDVMAGKAAGAHTAFLTNGGISAVSAGDDQPDYIIGHLEEMIDILELPTE
ncbi:MAG: HAD family hydrolase [Deltaproteobacteria bacterium]|nr:HAD family hydrolase [Deltaproteobacteria bacterium]